MRVLILVLLPLFLSACVSTKSAELFVTEKIEAEKVIAVSGTRAPWVYEIEKRLKSRGFTLKRLASQQFAIEQVNESRIEAYNDAAARFLLIVDGYAPNNSMERCFGGGYRFDYIDLELIDLQKNETVLHYANSGYSENCPPLSGTIFSDIGNLVASAWE